jgi:hypothetical protein
MMEWQWNTGVAAQEVFQEAQRLARWVVTRPNCSFFCTMQEDELVQNHRE